MVAGFIVIFATDYLIHGVWLMPAYNATKSLWRPDAENECARSLDVYRAIPLRDVLCSYWAKGFARLQHWCRLCGGLLIGLFQEVWVLVDYVVAPIPGGLAVKWFFSGLAEVVLLAIVTGPVYKPAIVPAE